MSISTSMADGCTGDAPADRSTGERIRELLHPTEAQWNDWRWHFKRRITTVEQLARIVPLAADDRRSHETVARRYPLSITPFYLSLAGAADPADPVLRQALPSVEEVAEGEVGEEDPLDERSHSPVPGLVHRYPDRALITLTNICSVLCRFCTRKREWDQGNWVLSQTQIRRAIDYIRANRAIHDVIISGGDPLVLDNPKLEWVLAGLRSISHVEIIRIGTRIPAVLPQRIDEEFCGMCERYGPIWLNTHFNHPNEVTPEARRAVRELLRAGVPVNNQSVLLRGVNDSLDTQLRLSRELLKIGVRPYYLYQADEVRGTEHFRTPVEAGVQILYGMRGHVSGLGVPLFVVDLTHGGGKVPVLPDYLLSSTGSELLLRNHEGQTFRYRNPGHPAPRVGAQVITGGNGSSGKAFPGRNFPCQIPQP